MVLPCSETVDKTTLMASNYLFQERKGGNQLPAIGSSGLNHSIRKRAPLSTADFGKSYFFFLSNY